MPRSPRPARPSRHLRASLGSLLLAAAAGAIAAQVPAALAAPAPAPGASAAASSSAPRTSDVVGRVARTGQLVMGAPSDLPPLVFRDASGQWAGYAVDVGRAIAAEIGMAVGRPVQLSVEPTASAQ